MLLVLAAAAPAHGEEPRTAGYGTPAALPYTVPLMSVTMPASVQPAFIVTVQQALRVVQDNVRNCVGINLQECMRTMTDARAVLQRPGEAVVQWAQVEPVRNNMFFYLRAPSFLLVSAIVRSGDGCDEWQQLATRTGSSLRDLLADASHEVSGRERFPEFKELSRLQARIGRCPV